MLLSQGLCGAAECVHVHACIQKNQIDHAAVDSYAFSSMSAYLAGSKTAEVSDLC